MKKTAIGLSIAAAVIWGYNIGTLTPAVKLDDKRIANDYMARNCELLGDSTGAKWYECSK